MDAVQDALTVLLWYASFSVATISQARRAAGDAPARAAPAPAVAEKGKKKHGSEPPPTSPEPNPPPPPPPPPPTEPLPRALRVLIMSGVLLPWVMQEPILRVVYSLATIPYAVRVLQIRADPQHFAKRSVLYALAFVFIYHDLRRAQPRSRMAIAKDLMLSIIISGTVIGACTACYGALATPAALAAMPLAPMLLLVVGAIHFFVSVLIVDVFFRSFLLPFGIDVKPTMDRPWTAVHVGEFWRRWNGAMQEVLAFLFYHPLVRKGYKELAMPATFLGSGFLHVYPMLLLDVSAGDIFSMFSFFVLQIFLIIIERRLQLKGRLWALGSVAAFTPLFIAPILKMTLLKDR